MATYTSYTTRKPNTSTITIAPNIADIDLADTYQQLVDIKNTSIGTTLGSSIIPTSELQAAMDYRTAFKQGDVITSVNNFFATLNSKYINQSDFSLDTVLYWYYKYKYGNKEITAYKSQASFYNQNILLNQLPGASLFANNTVTSTNISSDYFDIVSDSIGVLANSKFIQLDSTLPLFDVSQQYYGTPIPIAASTDSKISANTRNVMYNLSQKTTMYMKRNLLNIGYTNLTLQQNLAADATTSHGLNLINDLPTFVSINKMLNQFKSALGAAFTQTKAFSFVQYLNTIGNTASLNLRDIFPVAKGDRDFLVVTSQQSAAASITEAQQEQSDAVAAAALAQQQLAFAVNGSSTINGNLQPITPGGNSFAGGPTSKLPTRAPSPTNNPVTNYIYSIGARETGFSDAEANSNAYNQGGNNTNVAAYGQAGADYGYYQMNQQQVDQAIKNGMDPSVAAALNNGGGNGGYTLEQQTAALQQYIQIEKPAAYAAIQSGDYDTANSILKGQWPSLPGGLSHRSGNDSFANNYLQPVNNSAAITSASTPVPGVGIAQTTSISTPVSRL